MLTKFLAAAVIGTALMTAPALAQNAATTSQTATAAGLWQASKLISLNVYNNQNEKIGDIKELMVDKSGSIASVVIGVGGFLGMGERDVAVKFSDLKWSDEPVSSSSASTTPPARPGMTTGAASGNTTSGTTKRTYPDHAVFNASKDQLKAMPQFDYNK
jgi:hypothetical protein